MSKNMKALALAVLLACSALLGTACSSNGDQPAGTSQPAEEAAPGYTIKVVDAFGTPVTEGVIIRFMQNGAQVTMDKIGADGTVYKELEDGEYTVELQMTGNNAFYYDSTDMTVHSGKKTLEIVLYSAIEGEPEELFARSLLGEGSIAMPAYNIAAGGTYVELEAGERNYYIFTPTEAGKYEIKVNHSDAVLGYYGIPMFVQDNTITEPVDGTITVDIKKHMIGDGSSGTTNLVIGLDATGADTTAVLTIERIGDPDWSEADEPYIIYEATTPPQAFDLPAGTKTRDFDLKAKTDAEGRILKDDGKAETVDDGYLQLVLGDDGFYYVEDEKGDRYLVLVQLGKTPEEKEANFVNANYLPSLEEMATKALLCKYFYDEDGNFIKKEAYNECLKQYIACADAETGLYPLTEDLKYIIQQRGDHYGWFEEANTKHGYIFMDNNGNPIPGINNEISWLVLCCYTAKKQ